MNIQGLYKGSNLSVFFKELQCQTTVIFFLMKGIRRKLRTIKIHGSLAAL
jgi:hypothetical protein